MSRDLPYHAKIRIKNINKFRDVGEDLFRANLFSEQDTQSALGTFNQACNKAIEMVIMEEMKHD
jgi:hypothetical protein